MISEISSMQQQPLILLLYMHTGAPTLAISDN